MDSVFYVVSVVLLFLVSLIFYSQLMFIEGFILQLIAIFRLTYPFIKEI